MQAAAAGDGVVGLESDSAVYVLLVEDSPGDAFLTQELLSGDISREFVWKHVTRLSDAVELLRTNAPDATLVDLGLPDARGLQAVRSIRAAAPNVALVVLTGRHADEGMAAVRAGADDYLSKQGLSAEPLRRAIFFAIERRRLLGRLFAGVSDGVLVIGFDGVVRFANAAAEKMFDRPEQAMLGLALDVRWKLGESSQVPLANGRLGEVEWSEIDWYGEAALVGTLRDISERRRLEEMQMRLAHADKLASIGRLTAGVAHEINNPVAFVTMNMYAMRDLIQEAASLASGRLVELFQQMEEILAENTEGMARIRSIIEEMRAFARADRDITELLDFNDVVRASLRFSQREIQPRAKLVIDLAAGLPRVMGNRGQLIQVFLNLMINAAQAIEIGAQDKHQIRIQTVEQAGRVLAILTAEGGGGPAPRDVPFVGARDREAAFGLAMVAGIIADHEATIDVEATPGRGTEWQLSFPIATAEQVERAARADDPARVPMADSVRDRRVLVIDDEDSIRRALTRLLVREWDVAEAASGAQALAMLADDAEFDAVLCDLMMPEMDGINFYAHVAEQHPRLAERILFITGGAVTPAAREFLGRFPDDRIVAKPFDASHLMSAISRVAER